MREEIAKKLTQLEDKLQYMILRYTQLMEENNALKTELLKEKETVENLAKKIDNLLEDRQGFDLIRQNVISKVENLVYQLSKEEDSGLKDEEGEEGEDRGKRGEEREGKREDLGVNSSFASKEDKASGVIKEGKEVEDNASASNITINFLPE